MKMCYTFKGIKVEINNFITDILLKLKNSEEQKSMNRKRFDTIIVSKNKEKRREITSKEVKIT